MKMEYLFVYGMFRDSAKGLLEDAKFCNKDYIHGIMYRVNEFWPGVVLNNKKDRVLGDVYLIKGDLFSKLDEFEGEEYRRVRVRTVSGVDCWVYEWALEVDNLKEIDGGDWILR